MQVNLDTQITNGSRDPNQFNIISAGGSNGGVALVTDPGTTGATITPTVGAAVFKCLVTTAGAETRVLGAPDFAGQRAIIVLAVDGGDLTMTNASGWLDGGAADNLATFGDAGDSMICEAHGVLATDWRVTSEKGIALA